MEEVNEIINIDETNSKNSKIQNIGITLLIVGVVGTVFFGILDNIYDNELFSSLSIISFISIPLFFMMVLIRRNQLIRETIDKQSKFIESIDYPLDDIEMISSIYGIGINEIEEVIYIYNRKTLMDDYTTEKIHFKDIIECAIVEDQLVITKTSKAGLVGGSLIGGTLFGGAGAIVGALGADKSNQNEVEKLSLMLIVDDLMNPIRDIILIERTSSDPTRVKRDSEFYKILFSKATKWNKRFSIIIERNNKST